jgi:CubicO group peptidase (beta-lactamase class C family)
MCRKHLLSNAIVVCCLVTPSTRLTAQDLPTAKPEDVSVSPEKVTELTAYMQSLIDDGKIAGGVTMLARHGKVVHLNALAMADREGKIPMQTDSIFRMASMTKPVTSVAILKLYEQGKLGLDDPVSKYLPEFRREKMRVFANAAPLETKPAKNEITIKHLLTHTSGLGYGVSENIGPLYKAEALPIGCGSSNLRLDEVIRRLAKLPLGFEPGTQWNYGMNMDVLSRVIEEASGGDFVTFIEQEVFLPLGMSDSHFLVPTAKRARVASAYLPGANQCEKLKKGQRVSTDWGWVTSDFHTECNAFHTGSGTMCSTAEDYMRFCQMLLNGGHLNGVRILKEETVTAMTTDQIDSSLQAELGDTMLADRFGYGVTVYSDDAKVHKQLRGGYAWFGGWGTQFRVSPKGDWILLTLTQIYCDPDVGTWWEDYERIAAGAVK